MSTAIIDAKLYASFFLMYMYHLMKTFTAVKINEAVGKRIWKVSKIRYVIPQAAQTLFVIYIRDSIALRFEQFKRMYENGSKIALNSTCSKGFK